MFFRPGDFAGIVYGFAVPFCPCNRTVLFKDQGHFEIFPVFVSAFFSALAFLVKPTVAFFLLPLLPIFISGFGVTLTSVVLGIVYVAVSLVPLLLWEKMDTAVSRGNSGICMAF